MEQKKRRWHRRSTTSTQRSSRWFDDSDRIDEALYDFNTGLASDESYENAIECTR